MKFYGRSFMARDTKVPPGGQQAQNPHGGTGQKNTPYRIGTGYIGGGALRVHRFGNGEPGNLQPIRPRNVAGFRGLHA